METAKFLRNLGLTWITIAEAISDKNIEKTEKIIKNNPQITKAELLETLGIEEFQY